MDTGEAQRVISDMDAGRIQWDDNLRARANTALAGSGAGRGATGDYKSIAAESLKMLREAKAPAIETLREREPLIGERYVERERELVGEREAAAPRYKALLEDITRQQEVEETAQTRITARELGQRGIPSTSTLYQQELRDVISPIGRYYTGQAKEVGLRQEDFMRQIGNLIDRVSLERKTAEQELAEAIAGIQAATGTEAIGAAQNIYAQQEQSRQAAAQLALQQLQQDLAREQFEYGKTVTQAPELKYADVLGGGYLYDPTTGGVVSTLKDIRGLVGGGVSDRYSYYSGQDR